MTPLVFFKLLETIANRRIKVDCHYSSLANELPRRYCRVAPKAHDVRVPEGWQIIGSKLDGIHNSMRVMGAWLFTTVTKRPKRLHLLTKPS
jgi:hypothetical protein